ncbi:MAG: YkgJ family cysteine cluster protein [Myxococcaceae bacterium]
MSPDELAWKAAVTETRAVLQKASETWAAHSCPGTAECCAFPVQSSGERRVPWLWPSEWRVLLQRLARDKRPVPPPRDDGACPFLSADSKCTVYADRPFGCRTFFCHRRIGPAKEPAAATHALLERIGAANLAVDSDAAPRSLLDWLR